MKLGKVIELFKHYQKSNLKYKTIASYRFILRMFLDLFGDVDVESIGGNDVLEFLNLITTGRAKATKHLRFAQAKAFFNFAIENCKLETDNPCDSPLLNKTFRASNETNRRIIDKDTLDEIIYRTDKLRDRLILELQARCGLRIGEVLKIRPRDIEGRKINIPSPKSGKDSEYAFMPEPVSSRLAKFITKRKIADDDTVFHLSYSGARLVIKRIGAQRGVHLNPHDLRRHATTYASRSGVPLEIISKVILRHQDLRTTQIYLGKVSDSEAIRWIDILYKK